MHLSVLFCQIYRPNLHAIVSKEKGDHHSVATSSHVNDRYLSAHQLKDRMTNIRRTKKWKCLQLKINGLKAKLAARVENESVMLDEETAADFQHRRRHKNVHILFTRIILIPFLAATEGGKNKGRRWHPLIIRWCLYVRRHSSKAYDALRDSGCILLPSQRTLRDYSHCVKASAGYSTEEDRQLKRAANIESCPEWHKLVIILIDEMYIKESLVFDKHSGRMVGFVDLGEVNNHLAAFERSVESKDENPSTMVAFMVLLLYGLRTVSFHVAI